MSTGAERDRAERVLEEAHWHRRMAEIALREEAEARTFWRGVCAARAQAHDIGEGDYWEMREARHAARAEAWTGCVDGFVAERLRRWAREP